MSITAVVEKGLIKLPKNVPWASGTVVRIEPVEKDATQTKLPAKQKSWPVAPPAVSKKESRKVMKSIEGQNSYS